MLHDLRSGYFIEEMDVVEALTAYAWTRLAIMGRGIGSKDAERKKDRLRRQPLLDCDLGEVTRMAKFHGKLDIYHEKKILL